MVKHALHRHKRVIAVLFCVLALLLTTLAWAGLSLRDGLAAVRF